MDNLRYLERVKQDATFELEDELFRERVALMKAQLRVKYQKGKRLWYKKLFPFVISTRRA